MIRVQTFTTSLEIFKTARELSDLDQTVNDFIASNNVKRVVCVSDATTNDSGGRTIGLIRSLTYEA